MMLGGALTKWAERLRAEAAATFPERPRFGPGCDARALWQCASAMRRERAPHPLASNETNYCVRYQTGSRLLAARALSRLLHDGWPCKLYELEALRKRW
jgi:hypothetical protein